jgi:hypothetical protein
MSLQAGQIGGWVVALGVTLGPGVLLSSPAHADEPANPVATLAAQLVTRLGDDSFQARQEAARQLVKLGLPAEPALRAALDHPDREIRLRAKQLIEAVRNRDYHVRLAAFEADVDGRSDANLPGWTRYKTLVGDAASSRRLFVAMHKEEPDLMLASEGWPSSAGWAAQSARTLEKRCQELQAWLYEDGTQERELTPGTAAAFYLVASDERIPLSEVAAAHITNLFNYRPTVPRALEGQGPYSQPLKRLVGAWLTRDNTPYIAMQNFTIALQYGLREALPSALKMLDQAGADVQCRQYAIHVVGRFGATEHVPPLSRLLEDKTVCMTLEIRPSKTVEVQVRDIALGVLLHLTGQNLKDYGYSGVQRNSHWVFLPGSLRFEEESQRERALVKWHDWAKAQPAAQAPAAQPTPSAQPAATNPSK